MTENPPDFSETQSPQIIEAQILNLEEEQTSMDMERFDTDPRSKRHQVDVDDEEAESADESERPWYAELAEDESIFLLKTDGKTTGAVFLYPTEVEADDETDVLLRAADIQGSRYVELSLFTLEDGVTPVLTTGIRTAIEHYRDQRQLPADARVICYQLLVQDQSCAAESERVADDVYQNELQEESNLYMTAGFQSIGKIEKDDDNPDGAVQVFVLK